MISNVDRLSLIVYRAGKHALQQEPPESYVSFTPTPPTPPSPPEPENAKSRRALWITIAGMAVLLVVLGGFSVISTIQSHHDINQLHARLATDETELDQTSKAETSTDNNLSAEIRSIDGQITSIQSDVSALNTPTDPLSAYNSICHGPVTNSSTGVVEIYYYPCTDAVIPTPGG